MAQSCCGGWVCTEDRLIMSILSLSHSHSHSSGTLTHNGLAQALCSTSHKHAWRRRLVFQRGSCVCAGTLSFLPASCRRTLLCVTVVVACLHAFFFSGAAVHVEFDALFYFLKDHEPLAVVLAVQGVLAITAEGVSSIP